MKKLIALILVLAMTLSLAACGSGEEPAVKETPVSTGAAETPAPTPTPDNVIVTETPEEALAQISGDPYAEIEATAEAEVASVLTQLATEWAAISANVTDYGSYLANLDAINSLYAKIYVGSAALCVKMQGYAIQYAEAVLASGKSNYDMYDDLEEIYDLIYEDLGDDIYDGIYEGVLEEMYDALYEGALDEAPEDADYGDWLDVKSDEYGLWLDMRSDTYEHWLDYRSDVYGFYLDVRGEVFADDMDAAREEIAEFAEDTEELWNEVTALLNGDQSEAAPAEAAQTEEAAPAEIPAEQPAPEAPAQATDGIRPEFKEAMDSYEEFFDEYVAFMKSYMEDPLSMMGEYASMMTQYAETMTALGALDDGTLSDEEALYYAEVTLRINQKLLEVAS